MDIGWNSNTDTFFISGLTEPEAGALQGTIASLLEGLGEGVVVLGEGRLGKAEHLTFLCHLQSGLLRGHEIRQKIKDG